ncbi:MAG: amino acid carrier protein [Nitrospinaceae bacterium]|nr:sodium:alanine symporter family protein [Nitrospinaceae bacterium]NIR56394.1 sodium:alanine symporter family protein [Nitrospinaceae bacterium]NIS86858.1 sodium:alanine symporter family protein [Nitrospinaceae bacterium]NIT83694.1 sodium:alanine symporter family protein [Nitrospinaceae bacterium]NIU45890.1 sodium:alanine symporter family protein [Nitrospinaceae bacterium]
MKSIEQFFADLSGILWGPWLLVLLVGTGIWLTFVLRGIQFRLLGYALRLTFTREREGAGDVSHFGALMVALAATIGSGNIAGVATAMTLGGPGAVVWMWIAALFGMATKYAEGFLAVRFREVNHRGEIAGGPMYYIQSGLGWKWLGILFAFCGAIAAFGIGNMVQANTTAEALTSMLPVSKSLVGIVLAVFTALVILGGIQRIAEVVSFFVPIMVLFYFAGSIIIIISHWNELPAGLSALFQQAMSGAAASGGFAGATVAQAIQFGVERGMFSNESGMGSAPIVAAAAKTNQPAKQALVSMTGTFLDTIIVCSLTGLVLSTTGVWNSGETGAALTLQAFKAGLPGEWGSWIVTLGVVTFAFSTILGWCYYGEKCFEYLCGEEKIRYYRIAWIAFVFLGAAANLKLVWDFSGAMNALMAIPNLIALLALSRLIARETRNFEKGVREGTVHPFD